MNKTLFPTTVIGSLPRPAWVLEIILDRKAGRISEQEANPLLDRAIEYVLALQERAGLDEITDGGMEAGKLRQGVCRARAWV